MIQMPKSSPDSLTPEEYEDYMEVTLNCYGVLTHMGFKCITKDGADLTDDLKKAVKISKDQL